MNPSEEQEEVCALRHHSSRSLARIALTIATAGVAIGVLAVLSGSPGTPVRALWLHAPADPQTSAVFVKAGCIGCHTIPGVPGATGLVGPNLSRIGAEAATRKPGMDAKAYIRESIVAPEAFIAPQCPNGPCPSGVMLANFVDRLTPAEIDLIVTYLSGLTGDAVSEAPAYVLKPMEIAMPLEVTTPFTATGKEFKPAEVLLGKYLFFDNRLSADTSMSCATCHQPDKAFTDGKALSSGYPGSLYFRNTPTVMNMAFMPFGYWDGRLEGSNDIQTIVRDHLTEAHFFQADGRILVERMKQIPEYVQLFKDAYNAGPSYGRILNALAAYVLSLNSAPTPYDRFMAGETGALNADAQAGLELFKGKAGCSRCHTGNALSDNKFYALGVPENPEIFSDPLRHITFRRFFRTLGVADYRTLRRDIGLRAVTQKSADAGKFRTAPLRELKYTAPYMHNGTLATLENVVQFYDAGGGPGNTVLQPLNLTDEEVGQLVAFLESLSSPSLPAVQAPELPAYQIRTLGENQ
ncbi:MAG: c-type cytochrome [Anaerolineae bacterium]|nr:c-type cytochrome [Anaerolineae bacterium]